MSEEEGKTENEKARFSDSEELFESIFRKELTGAGKQRTETPKSGRDHHHPKQTPAKAEVLSPPSRKPPTFAKKPSKQISKPAPKPEEVKRAAAAAERHHHPPAKRKSESRLKVIVLVILLVVFCGALLNYFGVLDLSRISNLLGLGERTVAQAPQEKATRADPTEPEAAPPKVEPEQKAPPTKITTQSKAPVTPGTVEKPPVPAPMEEIPEREMVGPEIPPTIPEFPPEPQIPTKDTHATLQAKPMDDEGSTKAAQIDDTKAEQKEPVFSHVRAGQYPYSIYLGSYAKSRLEKAISIYQEKGLAPYWVKVDLGDKGVWFRVFAGYFRSKEAAEGYIKANRLDEAEPRHTKYAVFLGEYQSADELNRAKEKLLSIGFCPYSIKDANEGILLYSGAFYRKDFAEKAQNELISKGIKAELVER